MRSPLLVLLLACVTSCAFTLHHPRMKIQFEGKTVTKSFVGEAQIGHAQFTLHNHGDQAFTGRFVQASLRTGGESQVLQDLHLFDNAAGKALEGLEVTVGAGDSLDLDLSFVPVPFSLAMAQPISVAAAFSVQDDTLHANSEIIMQRRIPKR